MNRLGVSARRGYSMIETVLAAILLGLLLTGWLGMLSDSAETSAAQKSRTLAMGIASTHVEALRTAGPIAAQEMVGSHKVSASGELDPAGEYSLLVERDVRCNGGIEAFDNAAESPLAPGCGANRATLRYTVRVSYPYPGRQIGSNEIAYSIDFASWNRGAGSYVQP